MHSHALTSTQYNGCHKQSQVTVIELQSIEFDGKLKLGLHDLTERFAQTPQELSRHKALSISYEQPVFIH